MPVDLKALATELVMRSDEYTSLIPAGYTYLGQMISHDLVPPTGSNETPTAKLNLDSIYSALGEDGFPATSPGRDWDLPRHPDGKANIPESRNDENIIIAQLHRLWQKLHENIVRHGAKQATARNDVILLFQSVVIDDYLRRILQPHVFQAYFRRSERHLGFAENTLPGAFSHAAFRFGHSMVRSSYVLRKPDPAVQLSDLFGRREIPMNYQIEWSRFFELNPSDQPQFAMGIDTFINETMANVPSGNGSVTNTVLRNLQAGIGLPTGVEYVTNLLIGDTSGSEPYPAIDPEMRLYKVANDSIQVLGISGNQLPLWPYLLLEGELQGQRRRLGVLGSLIVAETLQNAIRTASPSVFRGGVYRFSLLRNELSVSCSKLLAKVLGNNLTKLEKIDMPIIVSMANFN